MRLSEPRLYAVLVAVSLGLAVSLFVLSSGSVYQPWFVALALALTGAASGTWLLRYLRGDFDGSMPPPSAGDAQTEPLLDELRRRVTQLEDRLYLTNHVTLTAEQRQNLWADVRDDLAV